MPALTHDVTIEQGATFQREFTVTSSDVSFTLVGSSIAGTLKDSTGNTAATFDGSATSANTALIELSDEVTKLLTPTTHFQHTYTVTATTPAGITYRLAQGQAVISAG